MDIRAATLSSTDPLLVQTRDDLKALEAAESATTQPTFTSDLWAIS
ncbi:hypothetical protein CLV40_12477 [Actinokineospora auranticolor]|uniref:Uncharacterized protein n=1 Tax=Actinokineospora auranticolor TaxID=155976 RepID=A0A2S6GF24_9PSEU|nr:hypothetical protein CLV40_12477 [Actinokineospora auranticolor]